MLNIFLNAKLFSLVFLVPLAINDRRSLREVEVLGRLYDFRNTQRFGHLHTGIDIVPQQGQGRANLVLASAPGVVYEVAQARPQQTVILEHRSNNNRVVFTAYKHLAKVNVTKGQAVNADTILGVTEPANGPFGPAYAHLHFEIRKGVEDGGLASYTSMNKKAVDQTFFDPLNIKTDASLK
jgi:murein DD-endopeptidase MepM/ murein hydrolase activator NlpD